MEIPDKHQSVIRINDSDSSYSSRYGLSVRNSLRVIMTGQTGQSVGLKQRAYLCAVWM